MEFVILGKEDLECPGKAKRNQFENLYNFIAQPNARQTIKTIDGREIKCKIGYPVAGVSDITIGDYKVLLTNFVALIMEIIQHELEKQQGIIPSHLKALITLLLDQHLSMYAH